MCGSRQPALRQRSQLVASRRICSALGRVYLRRVPGCCNGPRHVYISRLRWLCIPAGFSSPRIVLARRDSPLESPLRLWPSISSPMEHSCPLPRGLDLPVFATFLVVIVFLSVPPVHRGIGGLSAGSSLDRES